MADEIVNFGNKFEQFYDNKGITATKIPAVIVAIVRKIPAQRELRLLA